MMGLRNKILWGVALSVWAGIPVFGNTFTFNLNSLTGYNSNASNQESSIASQLQTQLQVVCPACTITATSGTGAVIDKTYTGENYAVGPVSGHSVLSETLGNTPASATIYNSSSQSSTADPTGTGLAGIGAFGNSQYSYSQLNSQGYTNQFLSNTNDSSGQKSTELSFQFGGMVITGASFNFEIFPDGTADQPPDFIFEAGNNTNGTDTTIFTQYGVTPSSSGSDGSSTSSPVSTYKKNETNAQFIGSWSGTFSGSKELDFVDWPATIGIDHLTITYSTNPEPVSIILFGTVIAGIFLIKRHNLRRA
jgi:hypothetical protein